MATRGNGAPASEDMEAEIARLREDVARLTARLAESVETAGAGAGQAWHRAEDLAARLERHIDEKPVQSAVIALVAGVVIGLLARR